MQINKKSLSNLKIGQRKGVESLFFNGEKGTYSTKHKWLVREFGNPKKCHECGIGGGYNKGKQWNIEWANISGKYRRILSDYMGLCCKCHAKFDGRVKNYNCGTIAKYKKGCRCSLCKLSKSLYRKKKIPYSHEVK